jgi:hypothetical protein
MARFYLDHCFPQLATGELASKGHDAVTSRERGRSRARDDDQLLYAAIERRILLTHNWKDFRLLHDAWRRWMRHFSMLHAHAGILVLPQGWSYEQYGDEIHSYVGSTGYIANELHRYDVQHGWVVQPPPS